MEQPREILQQIRDLGAAAGIALNPATPVATLEAAWTSADLVLVMSVPAGFGGQEFHEVASGETRDGARTWWTSDILLEVDGGVNDIDDRAVRTSRRAPVCGGIRRFRK